LATRVFPFTALTVLLLGLLVVAGCSATAEVVDSASTETSAPSIVATATEPQAIATPVPDVAPPTTSPLPTALPTVTRQLDDEKDDDDSSGFDLGSLIDLIGTQMAPFPTEGPPGGFPFPTMDPSGGFEFPDFGSVDLEPDTFESYVLPVEFEQPLAAPEWQPETVRPDFISGHTLMDFVSTVYLEKYTDSTLDAIDDTGAGWVFYDQYATYHSVTPPDLELIESQWENGFRSLSPTEMSELASSAGERGLKFGLMLELNYDGMLSDRNNPFSDSSLGQAHAAEQYIGMQADLLDAGDPEADEFWDAWFDEYSEFALDHALFAEEIDASMFVIGKQLGSSVREGNADRWKALITEVRGVYSGPIAYAQWVNENQTSYFGFPFEAVDYAIIYDWGSYSMSASSAPTDIEAVIDSRLETVYKPMYDRTNTPIIFLAAYQSREGALDQVWFEPTQAQPTIETDELTQAAMHQGLLRATLEKDWVAGVLSWGFWWRNDFESIFGQSDASFDRSSTIRGKIAHEIWRRWFDG
jgi:hypothetical protein